MFSSNIILNEKNQPIKKNKIIKNRYELLFKNIIYCKIDL